MLWLLLAFIGLFTGAFGTLIGAAGGFILVPILLFVFPNYSPATITSITLTVAFFNAFSGSVAYWRLKRTDFRSGLLFAGPAIIGAVIGASITSLLSKGTFQVIFASVLLLVSIYLMLRPRSRMSPKTSSNHATINITDSHGVTYSYSYSRPLGMFLSLFVGLLSGLLGIGGGIIHVPILTQLLNFPVHIATATSHFVVAISTFSAVVTHIARGQYSSGILQAVVLSIGAIIGAQFGARLSHRVPGVTVVRLLAAGLAIVAIRLFIASF